MDKVYKLYHAWYSWYICTIASNVIEYEILTRRGTSVERDPAILLPDVSANKHLHNMQLYVNIVHFLNLIRGSSKYCSTLTLDSAYDWWLHNCKVAVVNKTAVIGCTWLFVYQRARSYVGRLNAASASDHWTLQMRLASLGTLGQGSCFCARNKCCGNLLFVWSYGTKIVLGGRKIKQLDLQSLGYDGFRTDVFACFMLQILFM